MTQSVTTEPAKSEKPGFFKRLFAKLDASMKEKAEKQENACCCSDEKDKGGKCC